MKELSKGAIPALAGSEGRMRLLQPGLLLATGILGYFNSLGGVFLFDDRLHILGHRRLTTLWPPWAALKRHRPVVDYSFALNHAIFGHHEWGYHVVNVAIHLVAALALYGVVRRTLLLMGKRGETIDTSNLSAQSGWCAFAIAALWLVHPLQTQAVTYIVQRAESMMGMFYLLTLYCVIRGISSSRPVRWYVVGVLACGVGMGCKPVMITAPIVVLLYDRCLVSGSMLSALRARWPLYVALASTWSVSWGTGIIRGIFMNTSRRARVGFSYKGITPWEYLLTQSGVLTRYLKVSFWPHPLCLDYSWEAVREVAAWLVPGLVIVTLIGLTVLLYCKRPALGFLGVWFFVILSPTSSFVPIRDPLFEHRMYLPLAAVIAVGVFGGRSIINRCAYRTVRNISWPNAVAVVSVVLITAVMARGTMVRNRVYHREAGMWEDVLSKRPKSARAAENYGTALLGEGSLSQALPILESAIVMAPRSDSAQNALGFAYVAANRFGDAIKRFREAIRIRPSFERAHLNLGNALSDTGHPEEAMEHFAKAVRLSPAYTEARLNLGNAFLTKGMISDAIGHYREIIRIEPDNAKAWGNLGFALLSMRPREDARYEQAVRALQRAIAIDPQSHNALNTLGIALLSKGKLDEGQSMFEQALQVKPDFAGAYYNLGACLFNKGDLGGAIQHYARAIKYEPSNVNAHYELGVALEKRGSLDDARTQYRQALSIKPDHQPAREALSRLGDNS